MILQALLDLLQAEESEPDVERLIEKLLQTVHTTTNSTAVTLCLIDSVRDDLHCFSLTQELAVNDEQSTLITSQSPKHRASKSIVATTLLSQLSMNNFTLFSNTNSSNNVETEWVFRQGSISDSTLVSEASTLTDMINWSININSDPNEFLEKSFIALKPLLGDVDVASCLFMPILHQNQSTMALLFSVNKIDPISDMGIFSNDDEQLFHTLSAQIGSIMRRRLTQVLLERSRTATGLPVQSLLQIYGSNPLSTMENGQHDPTYDIATDTPVHNRFHNELQRSSNTSYDSITPVRAKRNLGDEVQALPIVLPAYGSVNVTRRPSLVSATQPTINTNTSGVEPTITIDVDGQPTKIAAALVLNTNNTRQAVIDRMPTISLSTHSSNHVLQRSPSQPAVINTLNRSQNDNPITPSFTRTPTHIKRTSTMRTLHEVDVERVDSNNSTTRTGNNNNIVNHHPFDGYKTAQDHELAVLLRYSPSISTHPWALCHIREYGVKQAYDVCDDSKENDICIPIWPSIPPHHLPTCEQLQSLHFNCWDYTADQLLPICMLMIRDLGIVAEYQLNLNVLQNFLLAVRDNYRDNPYHNFYHGFAVMQFTYLTLRNTRAHTFFPLLDQFSIMFAALCHDIDHPATNNLFHVNAQTSLARMHNDQAVLENHHAFVTFELLRLPGLNLFDSRNSKLTTQQCKQIRRTIILAILATDMVCTTPY